MVITSSVAKWTRGSKVNGLRENEFEARMQRGLSLDHLQRDCYGVGSEETDGVLENIGRAKRAHSLETLLDRGSQWGGSSRESNTSSPCLNWCREYGSFRDLLVNENIVIVEKKSSAPDNDSPAWRRKSPAPSNSRGCYVNGSHVADAVLQGQSPAYIPKEELPMKNTVQKYKDVFETLARKSCENLDSLECDGEDKRMPVVRSQSVRVTNADWRRRPPISSLVNAETRPNDSVDKWSGLDLEVSRDSPPPLSANHPSNGTYLDEEERDWLSACSHVDPDVIRKIRAQGLSVTFFGQKRPVRKGLFTGSGNDRRSAFDDLYDRMEWRKPKIVGVIPKIGYLNGIGGGGGSIKGSSSSGASSVSVSTASSDDEQSSGRSQQTPSSLLDVFRFDEADEDGDDEDDDPDEGIGRSVNGEYSYGMVQLNGAYRRRNAARRGREITGIWMRDPHWRGSSYVVFDFRGKDVTPHIRTDS